MTDGKGATGPEIVEEVRRVAAVRALGLLDGQPEERFDRITRLAARLCDAPMSLVALIDAERVFVLSSVGFPRVSIPRHHTLCALASEPGEVLVLPDAREEAATRESPLVQGEPGLRFYATVPLFSAEGLRLGSLSVADTVPRAGMAEAERQALRDLAAMASEALSQSAHIERLSAERGALLAHVQSVVSAIPLPLLVVAPDGTLRGWNPAAERVFGWKAEEVIGNFGPHCGPEHIAEGRSLTEAILSGRRLLGFETIRMRRDGTRIPVAISSAPLEDGAGRINGAVVVLEDISARRQAEIARDAQTARLRRQNLALHALMTRAGIEAGEVQRALSAITQAASAATGLGHTVLWLLDEDGTQLRRIAESRAARLPPAPMPDPLARLETDAESIALLGAHRSAGVEHLSREPHLARLVEAHLAPAGVTAMVYAPVFIGARLQGLLAGLHHEGLRAWTADERAFMASLADIAALAIEAGRRAEALARLEQAKSRAETANRAKSLFLANMGHELRTPLNAIIGFADLLKAERLSEAQRLEFAGHVRQAGQHLLDVFNDILEQARIDVGSLSLEARPMRLEPILRDAAALVQVQAEAREVTLRSETVEPLPVLQADPVKLRQAVVNLLANAVKFSPAGSTVRLTAGADAQGRVTLGVQDEGPGIPPEARERVFEPFTQLDEGLARRAGGAGLGLPIAKAYVELHGGELALLPAPGGGTLARIVLPPSLRAP